METLIIKGKQDTYFIPSVKLDAATGKCSISGESYLEEPYEFYQKLTDWFTGYANAEGNSIELDIKLTYFNTSSSRAILEMLRELKKLHDAGTSIIVNWFYPDPDNDEMLLEGEDFREDSGLDINLIKYELDS